MSTVRRTPARLLATLLLLTALSPIALVQAVPDEPSEYYYGVEYDWSSLDSDLQNVTGLDIQELFSEIMEDADDAGFNLDIGQLTTGASNVYVHQTEDITPQTIQDLEGNDVQVWSRTSDVVLRHGLLSNAVIMTDWSETTFGSEPTGFDIDVIAEAENVLTVDMLYTEYLDDQYQLIGADMDFDMTVGNDMNLGIDITLEGDGEELNIDFDTGMDFSYSIASQAEWRLGNPSPIYVTAAANDRTVWECVEEGDTVGVDDGWDDAEVYDMCGMLDGSYIGSADYNVYLTGLPMEEFGFDAGQFDISISDELTSEGDYEGEADMDDVSFSMRTDEPLEVDLGDGNTLDVTACDSCPPGNPVMFIMMGNVLVHASESFGEAVAEDFEAELEDSVGELIEDWFGIDEGGDMDDYDDSDNWFMCDSGEMIESWYVNDGSEDCMDGSDEDDLYLRGGTNQDWNTGEEYYVFHGRVDTTTLGLESDATIECYSQWEGYFELPVSDVNNGYENCDDGSDEYDNGLTSTFVCLDGSEISFELVNDGTADCADASDEPVDNEGDWYNCADYNGAVPWQWINDGAAQCDDGSDETVGPTPSATMFYCDDGSEVSFDLVNDGTEDCADGSDEGEGIYFLMDVYMNDGEGGVIASGDDLLLCAAWHCDVPFDVDSGSFSVDTEVPSDMGYGENTLCAGGSITAPDGTSLVSAVENCDSMWAGPEIRDWESNMGNEGDNTLRVTAGAGTWSGDYDDITMHWDVTDADGTVVGQGAEAFQNEQSVYVENMVDISGPGDYCLNVELIENGETEPFDTHQECMTVEDGPEVSERVEKIVGALAESGLENVLENFGNNLETTFQELDEDYEVPVFPYADGMWAPLWSNEHATIVGVGVYAWDEDGNAYVIAGPETTGYSQDLPMTFASIRYITGVPAQEAQEQMAEFDDLEDIVDVENHDLSELAADLEEAGADTSDLGLGDGTGNSGETTDDSDDGEETAEDIAEDAGLLPFTSPLTVMALIGLAALAGHRRYENE
ncbi:MAG: hypothetical protein VXY14_00395 [Candidatus Thermoplasmatota archaeon]|nr:hypothetical protein [Candidatus Thermoplasmatota archaeon]